MQPGHAYLAALSPRFWWWSGMLAGGLWLLGIPSWQAGVVFLVAWGSATMGGRTRLLRFVGNAVMFSGLAVWIGILPPPADWPSFWREQVALARCAGGEAAETAASAPAGKGAEGARVPGGGPAAGGPAGRCYG